MAVRSQERAEFWIWPMLVPVLPVLLAVILLQWIGAPWQSMESDNSAMTASSTALWRHSSDRLLFAAAVAVHTGVCGAAIGYFGYCLGRIDGIHRGQIAAMVTVVVLGVLGAIVVLGHLNPPLAIHKYSYFSIKALINLSPLARDLTQGESVSVLALWSLFPSAIGIFAVVMASAAASGSLKQVRGAAASRREAVLKVQARQILIGFKVLSAVLVSSTMTALFFYRFPLGLIERHKDFADLLNSYSSYASGLTTFWGTIYTLTLFSVYVGPVAALFFNTHREAAAEGTGLNLGEWCARSGIDISIGQSIKNALFLLAPLLVGPLGELATIVGS